MGDLDSYDIEDLRSSVRGLSTNVRTVGGALEAAIQGIQGLAASLPDLTQAIKELQSPPQTPPTPTEPSLLDAPIEAFAFEQAALTCFKQNGIEYLRDLCKRSEKDLYNIRNLGRERIGRIKALLNELDLHLAP